MRYTSISLIFSANSLLTASNEGYIEAGSVPAEASEQAPRPAETTPDEGNLTEAQRKERLAEEEFREDFFREYRERSYKGGERVLPVSVEDRDGEFYLIDETDELFIVVDEEGNKSEVQKHKVEPTGEAMSIEEMYDVFMRSMEEGEAQAAAAEAQAAEAETAPEAQPLSEEEAKKKLFYDKLPKTKNGDLDFDSMTSEQQLQYSEYEVGREATIEQANVSIKSIKDKIKGLQDKLKKEPNLAKATEIRKQIADLGEQAKIYEDYKGGEQPPSPTETAPEEQPPREPTPATPPQEGNEPSGKVSKGFNGDDTFTPKGWVIQPLATSGKGKGAKKQQEEAGETKPADTPKGSKNNSNEKKIKTVYDLPTSERIKIIGEPQSREEAIALWIMVGGKIRLSDKVAPSGHITSRGFKGHLGLGSEEAQTYVQINRNEGYTPEALAEFIESEDTSGLFANMDTMEILDVVLDVLSRVNSTKAAFKYIYDARQERQADEDRYVESLMEQEQIDRFGIAEADYEAAEEQQDEITKEEWNNEFADVYFEDVEREKIEDNNFDMLFDNSENNNNFVENNENDTKESAENIRVGEDVNSTGKVSVNQEGDADIAGNRTRGQGNASFLQDRSDERGADSVAEILDEVRGGTHAVSGTGKGRAGQSELDDVEAGVELSPSQQLELDAAIAEYDSRVAQAERKLSDLQKGYEATKKQVGKRQASETQQVLFGEEKKKDLFGGEVRSDFGDDNLMRIFNEQKAEVEKAQRELKDIKEGRQKFIDDTRAAVLSQMEIGEDNTIDELRKKLVGLRIKEHKQQKNPNRTIVDVFIGNDGGIFDGKTVIRYREDYSKREDDYYDKRPQLERPPQREGTATLSGALELGWIDPKILEDNSDGQSKNTLAQEEERRRKYEELSDKFDKEWEANHVSIETKVGEILLKKDEHGKWTSGDPQDDEYSLWRFPDTKTVVIYPNLGDTYYKVDINKNVTELTESEFEDLHKKYYPSDDIRYQVSDEREARQADYYFDVYGITEANAQEMSEIKAKAQANGTFMKAPNGKATKLNERQW
ncbi:MAG: hypothetical protein LBQ28_10930, partial [Prevotellaceae bacterium]|nr:hypothetical protein [Prevotellaceae bacterium]